MEHPKSHGLHEQGLPLRCKGCKTPISRAIPISNCCFCGSVPQSHSTLCNPVDCSMPGCPVLPCLLESAQTHVHWVGDAIQPSHPLPPPSRPALNLSRVFSNESALSIRWPKYSCPVVKPYLALRQGASLYWGPDGPGFWLFEGTAGGEPSETHLPAPWYPSTCWSSIQRLTVSGQSPPGFVTAPHNSSSSSVLAQGPRPGDSGPSSSPQVVIESDLYAPRPLELLPHRTDRRDGEGRRSGRFQNPRLQGPHPAKTPARPGRCIPALRAVGPPWGAVTHLERPPRCLRPGLALLPPRRGPPSGQVSGAPVAGERPPPSAVHAGPALNAPALGPTHHRATKHLLP